MDDDPPHFLIIANDAFSLVNFRLPLIVALIQRGVRVSALAPNYSEENRKRIRGVGATPLDMSLARAGLNPIKDVLSFVQLIHAMRMLRPDYVFTLTVKPSIYGMLAARLAGVPHRFALLAGLGFAFTDGDIGLSWRRRLARTTATVLGKVAFRHAHRVFLQNPDDRRDLVEWKILPPDRALVVGATGIDSNVWRLAAYPPTTTFILVSRLLREKGIVEFSEAARRVKHRHPEARFILLGAVDSNPHSLDAQTVGSWSHIEWHGHVDDVADWLGRSSVFVLPSYYREGIPRSIQEAMAIGRAIITTDNPGCRETVIDGHNGFLIPSRNVDALETAMLRFVDQPDLAVEMGRKSRDLALERFDVHKINARLLEVMNLL